MFTIPHRATETRILRNHSQTDLCCGRIHPAYDTSVHTLDRCECCRGECAAFYDVTFQYSAPLRKRAYIYETIHLRCYCKACIAANPELAIADLDF